MQTQDTTQAGARTLLDRMAEALCEIADEERWTHDVFTARLVSDKDGPWVMVDHSQIAALLAEYRAQKAQPQISQETALELLDIVRDFDDLTAPELDVLARAEAELDKTL